MEHINIVVAAALWFYCQNTATVYKGRRSEISRQNQNTDMKLSCSFVLLAVVAAAVAVPEHEEDYVSDPYGRDPQHRVKCSPPKRPQYGGHDGTYEKYDVGHTVTYHCDHGYDLYGSRYSTCSYSTHDDSGRWDKDTPYCKRNLPRRLRRGYS